MAAPTDGPPLSILRRLAYALLTLLLFAAGLEAVLAAGGFADPRARLSLTRGFSNSARYLVPDARRPGWRVTQMFAGETPEISIPPKGPRIRVIMLGGSNVEGFPTEWIRQQLDAAAPDPGFEVINLGRRGYGTERERILLHQALELQPDVVLIYAGHNEFVEAGFAVELARQWPVPGVAELVERLSGLRTMTAAVEVAEALRATPSSVVPEAEHHRGDELRDQTPDKTAVFYDVYRDNLRAMVGMARDAGARVVLATVVWNDFEPPFATALPADAPHATRDAVPKLIGEALALVPPRFRPGLIQTTHEDPPLHLQPTDWGESLTPEIEAARRAANVGLVAPALRPLQGLFAGGPFLEPLDTVAPEVPRLLATIAQVAERRPSVAERGSLVRSEQAFDRVLALAPEHPITLFDQGLVHYLLGDDDGAARLLRAASTADRAPVHANDRIDDATRQVALERAGDAGLRFVDVDAEVRAQMPQGLVGYEIMQDGCHLHRAARPALVSLLVPAIAELGRQAATDR